jgi:hypothetical protein
MSLVFKDERERSRRILLGLERAKAFDWERSARLVREIIAGTALAGINA